VQGPGRPGSDQVEVTYERIGAYARSASTPQLGTASARTYDLPENVQFGYLLVGIAIPLARSTKGRGVPAPHDAHTHERQLGTGDAHDARVGVDAQRVGIEHLKAEARLAENRQLRR
jgi:hypothetical protein